MGAEFERIRQVISLLRAARFEQAVSYSMPLVATEHSAWFLYARAWQEFSERRYREADNLLLEAYKLRAGAEFSGDPSELAFSLDNLGRPKLPPLFGSPRKPSSVAPEGAGQEREASHFCLTLMAGEVPGLVREFRRVPKSYQKGFRSVVVAVELLLHHELSTVGTALKALISEGRIPVNRSFIRLFSRPLRRTQLEALAEALWRLSHEWSGELPVWELASYLHYLLGDELTARELAERGLKIDSASLICGNVRALALNRVGRSFLADEQWRATLSLRPERSATYLVLGYQALMAGALEPALRYFHEAYLIGDNTEEAAQLMDAALAAD